MLALALAVEGLLTDQPRVPQPPARPRAAVPLAPEPPPRSLPLRCQMAGAITPTYDPLKPTEAVTLAAVPIAAFALFRNTVASVAAVTVLMGYAITQPTVVLQHTSGKLTRLGRRLSNEALRLSALEERELPPVTRASAREEMPPHLQSARCTPEQAEQGARFVAEWTARKAVAAPAPAAVHPPPTSSPAPAAADPAIHLATSAEDASVRATRYTEWHRHWQREKSAEQERRARAVEQYSKVGLAATFRANKEAQTVQRFMDSQQIRRPRRP